MFPLVSRFPAIDHAIVTRGPDGVCWRTKEALRDIPGRLVQVKDTIGAGDSFTAVTILGLLNGWNPERIIEAALDVSGFVCTQSGATPKLDVIYSALFRKGEG